MLVTANMVLVGYSSFCTLAFRWKGSYDTAIVVGQSVRMSLGHIRLFLKNSRKIFLKFYMKL